MNDPETLDSLESYELALVFSINIGEAGVKSEVEEFKKLISSNDGEVFNEDHWGRKDLAYMIKKESEGYYVILNFKSPTDKVKDLEKALSIHQSVLRYLILKTPVSYQLTTFEQYQEENKKFQEAKAKEKEEKRQRTRPEIKKPAPEVKRETKKENPVAKARVEKPEPKEEKIEKAVEKPKEPKELDKSKLEEFDEKLKNIINDPDISL